ncbi:ATP-binding protein [Bacteroides reticulotermitis]|uniref:Uncharacterized protein n=1 Tax=Bacteroides reticulotermitis JCM 10512 TaxID=1445607 RepID=W4UWU9_9BACE|nr:ATP-binding protein [Bacteroides reticulotermitis]GAE84969.1 hypothetical protein JCM10512_3355 [Bacteroides reticulotermitis JCM 10512]
MYTYKELRNGNYYEQDISYSTLMKKHIKKHSSYLQPIFEAISNSLEATNGLGDRITIRLNFSKTTYKGVFDFSSIDIIDTGTGFNDKNLSRLKCLYDESKGQNNLGTGRVQYLHFFHNTDIYSVFEEDGKTMKRRIVLSKKFLASSQNRAVIWLGDKIEEKDASIGTVLSFYGPIDENDKTKYTGLRAQQLKEYILVHYLSRFCLKKGNLQEIKIEQYMNGVHDTVNDCYIKDEDIPNADYTDIVKVPYSKISMDGKSLIKSSKTESFEIKSFRLPASIQKKNEVKLTSKYETVDVSSGIDFSFIYDSPKIGNGYLLFLISSSYLTNRDTDLRGNLQIYSRKDYLKNRGLFTSDEEILVDDIQEKTTNSITKQYEPIKKTKENFDNKIDELAEIFSLDRDVLNNVGYKVGDTDQEILKRVYQYDAEVSAKQDANIKAIIDSIDELIPGTKDFNRKLNTKIKKVTELVPQFNRAELTKYVTKRKVVLELMQKTIDKKLTCQQKTKKQKKINNEQFLHNILFNQHSENPLDSNLWMINDDFIHFQGTSESELRNLKIGEESFLEKT